MTIYNLYIFDGTGSCLYYAEWVRKKQPGMSKDEELKLMYGLIFSIKSFVLKVSPSDCKEGFLSYRTSKYRLNYFETASGLKFILNTDINSANARDLLQKLHREVFIEYVVKNPEYKRGQPINSEIFQSKLDTFIRNAPMFST